EMERIDVPLGRVVVLADQLRAELVRGRNLRPARLLEMVEGLAVDLLRGGVVDDVARLELLVLRAQPRVDPERLGAHDLLLLVARRDGRADVAGALPDARAVVLAVTEGRKTKLREGDGHGVLPLAADHLPVGDVLAKILPDLPPDDLPETGMILLDLLDVRIGAVHLIPSKTPSRKCSPQTRGRRTSRCRSSRSPSPGGSSRCRSSPRWPCPGCRR